MQKDFFKRYLATVLTLTTMCNHKEIYHYTSINTLKIILKNKTLRLTNMDNLMDTSEYYYGVNLLKKSVMDYEESKNILTNKINIDLFDRFMFSGQLYSISCTENGDDLNFWNSYYVPKDSAISIGFDKDMIFDQNLIFNRCIYGNPYPKMNKNTYEWFKSLFSNPLLLHSDLNFIKITFQTAMIKNPCFSTEREWRAVSFPLIKTTTFKRGQRECQCFDYPINLNAIKRITIGPSSKTNENIDVINTLIGLYIPNAAMGYSSLPVSF